MAEFAADRYGADGWFTDHRRILSEARPGIVQITTPPASHVRLAQDSLNAGAVVFLEKPATLFGVAPALAKTERRPWCVRRILAACPACLCGHCKRPVFPHSLFDMFEVNRLVDELENEGNRL